MKRFLIAAILIFFASALAVGAFAAPKTGSEPAPDPFWTGDLADFPGMTFVPPANSEYGVYVFSADGGEVIAEAEITGGGETAAQGVGSGAVCSAWLVSGVEYEVRVSGTGTAAVEIARRTLSRCADDPLDIAENETRRKLIARSGDAHWYGFTAQEDGMLMLTCVPEDAALSLGAALFDEDGFISEFEQLPGGACVLLAQTRSGRDYRVRLHDVNGAAGGYALSLYRAPSNVIVPAPQFDAAEYSIPMNGAAALSKRLAGEALLWVSGDPSVVVVDQDGTAMGLAEGTARITAYGLTASVSCDVRVEYVSLTAMEAVSDTISLQAGDEADLQLIFTPANHSDRSLRFRTDDPSVAEVSPEGVVKGVSAGETRVRVKSLESGLECGVRVVVSPAPRRYRALAVAEENYPYSEGAGRRGSRASAEAVASLLGTMEYESAAFVTKARFDLSRAELIAEIRSAFAGAAEKDVSLFYINCHGSWQGGMSFLELSDGSSMSARDLERELRRIPGTVVVLLDCCGSGGAIGAASEYAEAAVAAFADPAFALSKYRVICSAGLDQESYRVGFDNSDVMATAFARALCDGGGWDIERNARGAMNADADYDGRVSVGELQLYLKRRVDWILGVASDLNGSRYRQSVRAFPDGDPMILFER